MIPQTAKLATGRSDMFRNRRIVMLGIAAIALCREMKNKVFSPGRNMAWNDLTRDATGTALNAKAFATEFK